MNSDFLPTPRQELEARLTALLLGELPGEQAAALQQAIAQDAELTNLFERLKQTIALVRETEASPVEQPAAQPAPLTLSHERRQKLLQHFKTVTPKEFAPTQRRKALSLAELGVAAALVALLSLAVFWPSFNHGHGTFSSNASVAANDEQVSRLAANAGLKKSLAQLESDLSRSGNGALGKDSQFKYELSGVPPPEKQVDRSDRELKAAPTPIVLPSSGDLVDQAKSPPVAQGVPTAGFSVDTEALKANEEGQVSGAVSRQPGSTADQNKTVLKFGTYGLTPAPAPASPAPVARGGSKLDSTIQLPSDGVVNVTKSDVADLRSLNNPLLGRPVRRSADSIEKPPQRPIFTDRAHMKNGGTLIDESTVAQTPTASPRDLYDDSGVRKAGEKEGLPQVASEPRSGSGQPASHFVFRNTFLPATPAANPAPATPPEPSIELALPSAISFANEGRTTTVTAGGVSPGQGGGAGGGTMGFSLAEAAHNEQPALTMNWQDGKAAETTLAGVAAKSAPSPGGSVTTFGPGAVPLLGDMPVEGRLFKSNPLIQREIRDESEGAGKSVSGYVATDGAWNVGTGNGATVSGVKSVTNFGSLEVASQMQGPADSIAPAFNGVPTPANPQGFFPGTSVARAAKEAPVSERSRIVLPTTTAQSGTGTAFFRIDPDTRRTVTIAGAETSENLPQPFDRNKEPAQKTETTAPPSEVAPLKTTLTGITSLAQNTAGNGSASPADRAKSSAAIHDGQLLFEMGKIDEAEAKLKEAVKEDPHNQAAYYYLNLASEAQFKKALNKRDITSKQGLAEIENAWATPPNREVLPVPNPHARSNRLSANKDANGTAGWLGRIERRDPEQELAFNNQSTKNPAVIPGGQGGPTNVYSLGVVGYVNVDASKWSNNTTAVTVSPLSAEPVVNDRTSAGTAYSEAKRNLDELQHFRQTLDVKLLSERTETDLPKSSLVEIVDTAKAQATQSPGMWGRIRGALGGEVERKATIKVQRDPSEIAGLSGQPTATGFYDPYFIQTEFESLQSDAVLGKVVDDLKLNEAWTKTRGGGAKLNKEEAIRLLKRSLDLRAVKNTSLIDIGVKSAKPEEAANIANAIAVAYQAHRVEERKRLSEGSLKALEEKRQEQTKKIVLAKTEVERLQGETNTQQADVAPPKPPAGAPVPQPEIQTCDNAFSTFSLNVSDVSFKLAAASLEKGVMPDPSTIRSEEFINAFDYRDPEPPAGVPIGFAWERARYPFSQNRDLLRFSLKTAAQGRQAGRPLNIVLLLDNSGSMERADRVQIIHEALRVLATQLQAQDKLSVVTFSRTPRLWVDGAPGSQAGQVAEEVSGLTPEGGTNLEDAMNLAYQTALRHYFANGINRVVLLTDGAANLGNIEPDALKKKVEDHRKQGVAFDCFGIGWEGYNDDLLENLSRNGDGRYGFLNSPEEAATEFAGQLAGALHVAAADVKAQIEFNPNRVTAYRQIGYAKHQLTKEQFRDNTVDAAEIGAAESGNALYVIAVNPGGEGPLATVRVRYKVPGTSEYHEHEWPVPYAGSVAPLDQAGPAMRLAATASAFSEWLVSSPYATEVTPDGLLGCLRGVPEVYGADARPKKLEWMLRQAKSVAGK